MSAKNQIELVVQPTVSDARALDPVVDSLKSIVAAGGEGEKAAAELLSQLNALGQQQTLLSNFVALKQETRDLQNQLRQAKDRAGELQAEFDATSQPTARLGKQLAAAQAEVSRLSEQCNRQASAVDKARAAMTGAGVAATGLHAEQKRLNVEFKNAQSSVAQFKENLDAVTQAEVQAAEEAAQLATEQRRMAAEIAKIGEKLTKFDRLRTEFEQTRAEATRLGNQLSQTKMPSAALRQEFETSARSALLLQNRLSGQQKTLSALGQKLIASGADLGQFADVQVGVVAALNQSSVAAQSFERSLTKVPATVDRIETSSKKSSMALDFMKAKFLALTAVVAGMVSAGNAFDSMLSFDRAQRGFTAITGSAKAAAREIEYVREVSNRLGTDQAANMRSWLKFSAAVKGTTLEGDKARKVYESVNSAMANVGADANATESALRALEQMVSKGTVTSEEFKTQLADQLPGALDKAAKSIGVTKAEFLKLLETGSIVADDFLPKFAAELDKTFGGAEKKITGLSASFERFKNSLFSSGKTGNGLLGGVLTRFFDETSARINELSDGIDKVGSKKYTDGLDSIASSLTRTLGLHWVYEKSMQRTKKSQDDNGKSAQAFAGQQHKSATATDQHSQSVEKHAQSLYRQQIDLINARKALDENSKSSELAAKANVATADSALGVANAERMRSEALALSASSQSEVAEQARAMTVAEEAARQASIDKANTDLQLQEILLTNKHQDLTLSQQELFLLEQQLNSKNEVSDADRQAIATKKEKISAIRAEIISLKAGTEEAKANAAAVMQGADATASAFNQLGLRSQRQIQLTVERNRLAFEQIQSDVASGKATIEDSNAAFLIYARSVADSSKMATTSVGKAQADQQMALLRTQAGVKNLADEFDRLAGKGGGGGGNKPEHKGLRNLSNGVREVKTEAEKAKEAAEKMSNGFGEFSGRVGNDLRKNAEESASKTGQSARKVLKIVGMATEELGNLSQTALQAFAAQNQQFGDWMGIPKKITQLEGLEGALKRTQSEVRELHASAGKFGDSGQSFAAAIKAQTGRVLEQQIALEKTVQSMKNMSVTADMAAMDFDSLKGQFDLLDEADLSRLKTEIDGVNNRLKQTKDEARSATEELQGMADAAKQANETEIERIQREQREKLSKIDSAEQRGADQSVANEARQAVAAETSRQIQELQRRTQEAAKAEREKKTQQPQQQSPASAPPRVVEHRFPGESKSIRVLEDDSATLEKVVRALTAQQRVTHK